MEIKTLDKIILIIFSLTFILFILTYPVITIRITAQCVGVVIALIYLAFLIFHLLFLCPSLIVFYTIFQGSGNLLNPLLKKLNKKTKILSFMLFIPVFLTRCIFSVLCTISVHMILGYLSISLCTLDFSYDNYWTIMKFIYH